MNFHHATDLGRSWKVVLVDEKANGGIAVGHWLQVTAAVFVNAQVQAFLEKGE